MAEERSILNMTPPSEPVTEPTPMPVNMAPDGGHTIDVGYVHVRVSDCGPARCADNCPHPDHDEPQYTADNPPPWINKHRNEG